MSHGARWMVELLSEDGTGTGGKRNRDTMTSYIDMLRKKLYDMFLCYRIMLCYYGEKLLLLIVITP